VPYFDEKLFVETMNLVQSFALQEDEMRLYYNDRKNCLLFKLVEITPKLQGTTWKLVGFADVETGTLRKAVPEDCQRCYTITFDTDTTYSGEGCSNQMYGKYKIDYETSQIQILCLGRDKAASYFDEELLFETLRILQSFSLHEDELKLYYNDKKNCLLFNKKES
jgi:heat shock protein HslJ